MNVAEQFADVQRIEHFAQAALYLLAGPSVSDEVRQEALGIGKGLPI
jgi:hypothetical protein